MITRWKIKIKQPLIRNIDDCVSIILKSGAMIIVSGARLSRREWCAGMARNSRDKSHKKAVHDIHDSHKSLDKLLGVRVRALVTRRTLNGMWYRSSRVGASRKERWTSDRMSSLQTTWQSSTRVNVYIGVYIYCLLYRLPLDYQHPRKPYGIPLPICPIVISQNFSFVSVKLIVSCYCNLLSIFSLLEG